MNVEATIRHPQPIDLTADAFMMLKKAGAFRDFWKSELISGKLRGILREYDKEPGGDDTIRIKLRVHDYTTLDEAGIFAAYARTELVDGLVYEVSPQYREHGFVKDELAYRLRRALEGLGSEWRVATEQSVEISAYSQPQPDIVLTTKPRGRGAIPGDSVGLLVEIAVNTARYDLQEKRAVYAMAGVPEYWVVDIQGDVIHQMWSPAGETYAQSRKLALGETIPIVTIPGLSLSTKDL